MFKVQPFETKPVASPQDRRERGNSGLFVNKPDRDIFTRFLLHKYINPDRPVFDNLDLKFLFYFFCEFLLFLILLPVPQSRAGGLLTAWEERR